MYMEGGGGCSQRHTETLVYTPGTTTSTMFKTGSTSPSGRQTVWTESPDDCCSALFCKTGYQEFQQAVHLQVHNCGTSLFESGILQAMSSFFMHSPHTEQNMAVSYRSIGGE